MEKPLEHKREITQLKGLRINIDYGAFVFENRYPENDIVVWKSSKGKSMTGLDEGFEVTEKVTVVVPSSFKFFISWVEKTGLGVTQYLDLENQIVHSIITNENELTTEKGKASILAYQR